MAADDNQPSAVRAAKEPGGFWLPNAFVDCWAERLGPRGCLVYLMLARETTARHYPSVGRLAARAGCAPDFVRARLGLMKSYGLVNDYDLLNIHGYHLHTDHNDHNDHNDVEGTSDAVADDADAPDQDAPAA